MVTKYPDINPQASPHIYQSAINQQASPHIPQSANYSHFTEQSRRAGLMGPELGRIQQYFHPYPQPHSRPLSLSNPHTHPLSHPLSLSNPHPHPRSFHQPHSHEMHEAIQREIEKQRIRDEIIMSEIVRRRFLEAEVRRELLLERELALQRGGNVIPIGLSSVIGFESPTRVSMLGAGGEGRSLAEKERLNGRHDNGGFQTSPFQRHLADPRIPEAKPVSEGGKEKGKIILLAKPNEEISGSKRKGVTPTAVPDSSEPPPDGGILRKKVKEEWSCAVCQVRATSEQALNEHLKGKKHKSKEAALRAQRAGKNYSIGFFPKKPTKSIEVPGTCDLGPSESSPPPPLPLLTGKQNSENSEKNQSVVVPEAQKKDDSKKNRYRLWCELCQVGSHSKKIMNFHKRGKKHARRLEASQRNASDEQRTIVMLVNGEGVDEDGKSIDVGLEKAGPEDHGPDVADGAKDGEITVS